MQPRRHIPSQMLAVSTATGPASGRGHATPLPSAGGKVHKHLPILRLMVVFSVLMVLLNGLVFIKRGADDYQRALAQGSRSASQLTRSISEHVELMFVAADMILKRASERQYYNALFGNTLNTHMESSITAWLQETPQLAAVLITNEDGKIQALRRKAPFREWVPPQIQSSPFFTAHAFGSDTELLYVGWEPSGIKGHDGFTVLSRRLNKLDGSFGGVVMVAVNNDYVIDFFKAVENDQSAKLVLMREDRQLLINQLESEAEVQLVQKLMDEEAQAPNEAENRFRTFLYEGRIANDVDDNRMRLLSFSFLPNLGMKLSVVSYGEDVLALWRKERMNDAIFFAVFALFVVVVSLFVVVIVRQMRRAQHSESTALLASQAKSDFLANMSHELRTPLNAVIGFSEMLEAGFFGKLNAKQKERVHDIHYCGTHLLELINDILEFSKGEAGKVELRAEPVFIPKLIRETVRIFADRAQQKLGVEMRVSLPEDMPLVTADGRKIKQILLNLLSNSAKFTPSGGVVEASCGLDEQGQPYIQVTDSGCGIAEKDIPKALSAFGQVHQDLHQGGTGLGLPLCKMFSELHGGRLYVQSVVGKGTTVTVVLPAERVIWSAAPNTVALATSAAAASLRIPPESGKPANVA